MVINHQCDPVSVIPLIEQTRINWISRNWENTVGIRTTVSIVWLLALSKKTTCLIKCTGPEALLSTGWSALPALQIFSHIFHIYKLLLKASLAIPPSFSHVKTEQNQNLTTDSTMGPQKRIQIYDIFSRKVQYLKSAKCYKMQKCIVTISYTGLQ